MEAFQRPVLGHLDPDFLVVLDEIADRLRAAFQTTTRSRCRSAAPARPAWRRASSTCSSRATPRSSASTACSASACARSRAAAAPRSCASTRRGVARSIRSACSTRKPRRRTRALLAVVHAETSTGVENEIAPLARAARHRHVVARRHRHVARRHPARGRRVGDRRGVLGHAEVPRRAARPRAASASRRVRSSGYAAGRRPRSRGTSTSACSPTTSAPRAATTTPRRSRCSTRCTPASVCCSRKASRHRGRVTGRSAALLQEALPELGFAPFAEERRLPQLTSVWLPEGVDDAKVRGELRTRFDIEVGGGLGELAGKGWRIGLMGHSARERSVTTLLGAIARAARLTRRPARPWVPRRVAVGSRGAVELGRHHHLGRGSTAAPRSTRGCRRARGAARPCPAASCRSPGTSAGTAP